MDRVTHFEFATPEPAKERAFFTDVFGWQFSQWGDADYWLAMTGPTDKVGINGAVMPPPMEGTPRTVNTISVDDLDATIARATEAGATMVREKWELPGVGWVAYMQSPTGIPFGVIQPLPDSMM